MIAGGDRYVWFVWALAFLVPWAALYALFAEQRRVMLWSSALTALFGLTEPLFVPEYWNPPSLFDLAQRTGFDMESLIFCFGIGGVGAVLYNALTRSRLAPVPAHERHGARHRFHRAALATPVVAFLAFYFLPWNPIYPSLLAMAAGAAASVLCRPDLAKKTLIGGALFGGIYLAFLISLEAMAPGYVARVWNLPALSGVMVGPLPIEELLFGFTFGLFWTGVYEHVAWRRAVPSLATGRS